MTIGILAQEANVSVETIRYYQRVGLLEEPPKPHKGYRSYSPEVLEQLLFIRRAKTFGFSLQDIGELLKLGDSDQSCESACALAEKNLNEIRAKMKELEQLEIQISKMLNRGNGSCCKVLSALSGNGLN